MNRLINTSTTITREYVSILVTKWKGDQKSGTAYDSVWLLKNQSLYLTTWEKSFDTKNPEKLYWKKIEKLDKDIFSVLNAESAIELIKAWLMEKEIILEIDTIKITKL